MPAIDIDRTMIAGKEYVFTFNRKGLLTATPVESTHTPGEEPTKELLSDVSNPFKTMCFTLKSMYFTLTTMYFMLSGGGFIRRGVIS